jgi:hypothetical protein
MILAFKKTYQKLTSKGLDLVELEPKPVDHRQIQTGPALFTIIHDISPNPSFIGYF